LALEVLPEISQCGDHIDPIAAARKRSK
jgi:hypothetical protein